MVLIGHARGGDPTYTPGDGNGGEVRVQAWYDGKWDYVLRFRDRQTGERAARICRMVCENNEIGYSQARRNDLRAAAIRAVWQIPAIRRPADCDCSSLVSFCAEAAGVKNLERPWGNAPWTGNMVDLFGKTGCFEILSDAKYIKTDKYLLAGDILLNVQQHTAMALTYGELAKGGYAAEKDVPEMNAGSVAGIAHQSAAEISDGGKIVYTVIPGDTLWGIAVSHKTTVPALCEANGLDAAKFIYPGQKIVIPN